jgi:predicted acetyltransferase
MPVIARPYETSDEDAFNEIRSVVYNNGEPIPEERRAVKSRNAFVAVQDGEVAGIARIVDFVTVRGGAELATAGVAGVGVSPNHRQGGVGTELINWLVRHARETGMPISTLYAFRESFYRKMGYEVAGKRILINVPSHRLPSVKSSLTARRVPKSEWRQIADCYEDYVRARSGFTLRNEEFWEGLNWGMEHPAIYAFGDPVEAYAVVAHKIDFWQPQKIQEVVWSSEAGHRALMAWFAGLCANKTHVSWYEASDSPYMSRYLDQGVETKLERPMMYRIADVPKALGMLTTEATGEFRIALHDDLIDENRGPWRVAFSPYGVNVERCEGADLEVNIRSFAPAFFGEPSIVDLARNGLVVVKNASALKAAAELLPASPVGCLEFY